MVMVIFVVLFALAFASVYINYTQQNTDSIAKSQGLAVTSGTKNIIKGIKWDKTLYDNPLTRKGYRKIRNKLSNMAVYTRFEIAQHAVTIYKSTLLTTVGLSLVMFLIYNDLISIIAMVVTLLVVKDTLIYDRLNMLQLNILLEFHDTLSLIRRNFLESSDIVETIGKTIAPKHIQKAMDDIYIILTSTDGAEKLQEFRDTNPFRQIQTLAQACYKLADEGDVKDNNGNSAFIQALTAISDELETELSRRNLIISKYRRYKYFCLIPLLFLGVTESFMVSQLPATATIYKGLYGYLAKIVIIAVSTAIYKKLANAGDTREVALDDRNPIVLKLYKYKWFNKILDDIEPKSYRKIEGKKRWMIGTLTSQTLRDMYGAKLLFATVALVVSVIMTISLTFVVKYKMETYYGMFSIMTDDRMNHEELSKRKVMDSIYLENKIKPDEETTKEFVRSYYPRVQQEELEKYIDRITTKYDIVHSVTYHWWYLLICYIITIICWFLPEFKLLSRCKAIIDDSEEDVLQLQTFIIVLMNTTADTFETLGWLVKQSTIHYRSLLKAYHNYVSNSYGALTELREEVASSEFRRLIDRLSLTVEKVSLSEAFADLISERAYMLETRKAKQKSDIEARYTKLSVLAFMPTLTYAILYAVLPMGYISVMNIYQGLQAV